MSGGGGSIKLYKRLLKLASSVPDKKKQLEAKAQIKAEFRNNANVTDPTRLRSLWEKAKDSLGYLKIVTPKDEDVSDSGVKAFRYINGKRVPITNSSSLKDKARNRTGDMNETIKRHNSLMRRQYFMDRK